MLWFLVLNYCVLFCLSGCWQDCSSNQTHRSYVLYFELVQFIPFCIYFGTKAINEQINYCDCDGLD
jgi:hypothetical protein